jgi:hypothetical protein
MNPGKDQRANSNRDRDALEAIVSWRTLVRDPFLQLEPIKDVDWEYWEKMAFVRQRFLNYLKEFMKEESVDFNGFKNELAALHNLAFYFQSDENETSGKGGYRIGKAIFTQPLSVERVIGFILRGQQADIQDPYLESLKIVLRDQFSNPHGIDTEKLDDQIRQIKEINPDLRDRLEDWCNEFLSGWNAISGKILEKEVLILPRIGEKSRDVNDRIILPFTIFGVYHVYPDIEYLDSYLKVILEILAELRVLMLQDAPLDQRIAKIAEFYQYGINAHFFPRVNNSIFMNMTNALLELNGCPGIPHVCLDLEALSFAVPNFAKVFAMDVERQRSDSSGDLLLFLRGEAHPGGAIAPPVYTAVAPV